MSLSAYLAQNYLTADAGSERRGKKRKRKEANSGIRIADDDLSIAKSKTDNNDDEDRPTTISSHTPSTQFRRNQKSGWTTVGQPAPSNAELAAAEALNSSTAANTEPRNDPEEEKPQVVADTEDDTAARMESGATAGLQTAAQVSAAIARRKADEIARFAAQGVNATGKAQETIYRDATGRVVNVAMARAEARRKADAEERAEAEEKEAMRGDVQRADKEARRAALADAKFMTVARYADDAQMNEELKDRGRWNDPAAGFLAEKKTRTSVTGKPLYKGSAAPNRYGIRPGHRWDGVDRSIGFEKDYFASRNRKQNVKDLQYAWQLDV